MGAKAVLSIWCAAPRPEPQKKMERSPKYLIIIGVVVNEREKERLYFLVTYKHVGISIDLLTVSLLLKTLNKHDTIQ